MKLATLQKLLKKYHDGTATEAEQYVVDRWYESFANSKVPPGLESETQKAALKSRIWQGIPNQSRYIPWFKRSGFRIAAGVALALSISIWLYIIKDRIGRQTDQVVRTGELSGIITTGSRQLKQVKLPDSTQVWLNANSRLEVLPGYGNGERRIHLSGEAFFEVKGAVVQPFFVKMNGITVTVLGTSFNIQSYDDVQEVKVTVSTGKVLVADTTSRRLSVLNGGQQLAYRKANGSYRVDNVAEANSYAWRVGKVVLDRASFEELVQVFHNFYGVQLMTADKQVASYRYNLTLQSNFRQEEAMELICSILRKNYKKEDNGNVSIY
ncbi:anti-sigma factor [Parapedobacter defluvii]|uniref:Anti-sigma factor n=1 Tax=Parapedobacter defluvii TaxID=2045106 RepID=A0ABQ1LI40_9SPHI|nr:FecR domain-containing protein [Parapedobacter defluvii]GGC23685.1 anti-sigma factor [Parapedobacter defluvii]